MSKKTFILSRFYLWLTISITLLYFSLTYIGPLIVGFITALLIGLITINILYNLIKKHKFWMFSIYCWILGIILILTN